MTFYVTGDIHGSVVELKYRLQTIPEGSAIIILGDAGCNYYLNKADEKLKEEMKMLPYMFYLVRGNHEARPADVSSMELLDDPHVEGYVLCESEYPNIRYFTEFGIYIINNRKVGVIGGAYSVDKFYRLAQGWHWFENEQLDDQEKAICMSVFKNKQFDIILTHTCPYEWRPTDLFLPMIDQTTVDNSTEYFLSEIAQNCRYKSWAFGHYHKDRNIRPYVRMLFNKVLPLMQLTDWKSIYGLETDPKYHIYNGGDENVANGN